MELKDYKNSDMNYENFSETDVGSDSYFKSLEKSSDEQEDTKIDIDEEVNSDSESIDNTSENSEVEYDIDLCETEYLHLQNRFLKRNKREENLHKKQWEKELEEICKMKDISWIVLTSNLFIEVIKIKDKMNSFGLKTYEDIWSEMGFEVNEKSIVPTKIKTDVENASHQIMTLDDDSVKEVIENLGYQLKIKSFSWLKTHISIIFEENCNQKDFLKSEECKNYEETKMTDSEIKMSYLGEIRDNYDSEFGVVITKIEKTEYYPDLWSYMIQYFKDWIIYAFAISKWGDKFNFDNAKMLYTYLTKVDQRDSII